LEQASFESSMKASVHSVILRACRMTHTITNMQINQAILWLQFDL